MASSSTPIKPSPTANTKPNRLPAPSLFVGPPSRNASQLSVSRQQPHLNRTKSALRTSTTLNNTSTAAADDADPTTAALPPLRKASNKAIEDKWRQIQSTLNEVELTAQSSTHVFGESHARALDDLRQAQVELAHAWGRGDDHNDARDDKPRQNPIDEFAMNRFKGADDMAHDRKKATEKQTRQRADTAASTSTALSDESLRSDVSSKSGRSQLEDETARDIKLASERRAANEAYFNKVDGGVRNVVLKLEAVADAMRGVEGESRSLWSQSERSSGESEQAGVREPSRGKDAASGG